MGTSEREPSEYAKKAQSEARFWTLSGYGGGMKTLSILALWVGLAGAAQAQDDSGSETPTTEENTGWGDNGSWRRPSPSRRSGPLAPIDTGTPEPESLLSERERSPFYAKRECRRQVGVSLGVFFPANEWDLVGNGAVPTASPAISLICQLGGVIRPFAGMTTAPFQRHRYRELGTAGLYVMPSFGISAGKGSFRYGIYTVMMPRIIGAGLSVELRFKGTEGNWLTHTPKGDGKGFEVRFQVLDGDSVQYQVALMYTFGVNTL